MRRDARLAGEVAAREINQGMESNVNVEPLGRRLRAAFRRIGRSSGREFNDGLRFGLSGLRGSRNDFLNFIGSISRVFERFFARGFDRLFGVIGNSIGEFGRAMSRANGPLGSFGRGLQRFGDFVANVGGGGITGLAIQLGLLTVSLVALVAAVGPLVAGLASITAGLVAMTTALGGGLLGGILTLGPGLLALAAGAGAAAIGFSDLSKEQKRAFTPLRDWLDEVRDGVENRLLEGMGENIRDLGGALSELNPLLFSSAEVVRDFFDGFVEAVSGGAMASVLELLEQNLPTLLGTLLQIVQDLSLGLVGLFAAASPAANVFFEQIQALTEQFLNYVTSARGQEEINRFLTDAIEVLNTLGELIGSVSGIFSAFWQEGVESGQSLLDSLGGIVERFNAWLGTEAGREALRTWFNDAVDVMGELGELLAAVVELFDDLDSPSNREAFTQVLNFLTDTIELLQGLAEIGSLTFALLQGNTEAFNSDIQDGNRRLKEWERSWGDFRNRVSVTVQVAISRVRDLITRISLGVQQVRGRFSNMFQQLTGALGSFISRFTNAGAQAIQGLLNGIVSGAQRVINYVNFLAEQIRNTFASALSMFSPSRVFHQFGEDITQGLIEGIEAGTRGVQRAVEDLIPVSGGTLDPTITGMARGGGAPTITAPSTTTAAAPQIQIVTPYADPRLVALETVDALAARGR